MEKTNDKIHVNQILCNMFAEINTEKKTINRKIVLFFPPALVKPAHDKPATLKPAHVKSAKSKPAHVKLQTSAIMDATPVFQSIMNVAFEDTKSVPRHSSLACSVQDPQLVSVRAAGIPEVSTLTSHTVSTLSSDTVSILSSLPVTTQPSSPGTAPLFLEIDDVLSVLPVMVMAILCVWATHTTVVSPEVAAFAAEPPEVVAPTLLPESFS